MLNCPDCGAPLNFMVSDDKQDEEYTHIYEICGYCGYTKSFVEYDPDE